MVKVDWRSRWNGRWRRHRSWRTSGHEGPRGWAFGRGALSAIRVRSGEGAVSLIKIFQSFM